MKSDDANQDAIELRVTAQIGHGVVWVGTRSYRKGAKFRVSPKVAEQLLADGYVERTKRATR